MKPFNLEEALFMAPKKQPEVMAYHHRNKTNPDIRGVSLFHDSSCTNEFAITEPLIRLSDYQTLQAECERLRKDAQRYCHIKKGNQWIVAATQTGAQLDGEDLDNLIDSEMADLAIRGLSE